MHSKFIPSQGPFCPQGSYKLNKALIPRFPQLHRIRYLQCPSLRTSFTLFFLLLVSFCLPFHFTGILRVRRTQSLFEYPILRMYPAARNTGTCLFMFWTGLGCLVQCVNSIVWNKNMVDRAPVYCDIGKPIYALSLETSDAHLLSFTPQWPVFKPHRMLQSRLVHFASIAASTGLLRR